MTINSATMIWFAALIMLRNQLGLIEIQVHQLQKSAYAMKKTGTRKMLKIITAMVSIIQMQ